MTDRTVIAIGCSTNAEYNFLLPLTALLWREHIGHQSLALLVGSENEWKTNPRLNVALEAINKYDIHRHWLGHLDGYRDATLAQNCRLRAAAINIDPNAWIMPTDVDLWPIRKSFYQTHVGSSHRCVSLYWQGDHFLSKHAFLKAISEGRRSQTIPLCHVVMRAYAWRQVYGINIGENITKVVERTLDDWFDRFPKNDFNIWMSDQDIMTTKLCEQPWFPSGTPPHDSPHTHASGEVLFVPRPGHPPLDRLCRSILSRWQEPFDPTRWTDAHVHKTPYSSEHWAQLLPIIETLLPQHAEWAKKYHHDYIEASK